MFRNFPKSLGFVLICSLIIGIGAGLTNVAVSRAASENTVVGKVDMGRLNQEFPAMKNAWENIAKQKTALEKELNAKAEGQDNDGKQHLLDQYNAKYNDYARQQLEPAQKNLKDAISSVAKEKGVTVVIDSNVVYLGGIDMTDAVLKKGGAK